MTRLVQIRRKASQQASCTEKLLSLIDASIDNLEEKDWRKAAVPFYNRYPSTNSSGTIRNFPNQPGIYAVARLFVTKGKQHARVLYVGISHKAGVKRRLSDHFGKKRSHPDFYSGSRFVNALWEITQDENDVFRILNDDKTRIAVVPVPGASKRCLESLERLAILTLQPLLNVEGR
jgi:hypothetical protein